LDDALQAALRELLLALADDELILGQRDAEWCGHAPILEEDIGFANLALDELGHAGLWYALLADLDGQEQEEYTDRLVYFRDSGEYRCAQLVELPNGDWAFTMLRHYLFDAAEQARLEALVRSAYTPVADAAAKILNEENYHLRHTQAWIRRLGLGTEESHRRTQDALQSLWPYCGQLFSPPGGAGRLAAAGFIADPAAVQNGWEASTRAFLQECSLEVPESEMLTLSRLEHSAHLRAQLAEMQALARQEPEAKW